MINMIWNIVNLIVLVMVVIFWTTPMDISGKIATTVFTCLLMWYINSNVMNNGKKVER